VTHAITEFPVPTASAAPSGITAGPDGNLWFNEKNATQIGMINPTTHAINEFTIPSNHASTLGITAGPDGNLWFTEAAVAQIGMINPTTHAVTEFPIPYASSNSPVGVTAGPDGNLWFTEHDGNKIGVVALYQTSSTHLVITQPPPSGVNAGSPFGLTVTAEDGSGNPITTFNGTVTVGLANNPGGTTLGGPTTATASNGVAVFSGLALNKAAIGYMLDAYASNDSGLGGTVTSAMTVTPAAATQLVITQQPPATVKVSSPFTLKASIEDQYGNVVTTASGTVSVAFATNPTGATLGGTTSVTVSQGVASFTNLTINKTGSGYTLQVSSGSLTPATSNPVNVTQNGKAPVRLLAPAGNPSPNLSLAPLVLDSPDLWDGLRFKKRASPI
jgi:hypothetical protein